MTTLAFEIFAKDMASKVFTKIGGSADGMKGKLLGFGAAIATGAVAAGKALYDIGSSFDEAYDKIRVGTGATGDALAGLQDDFRAVAKQVPEDFGTIGQVIADLNTRTGATGPQLQNLATQILNLSHITGENATDAVAKVTRVFGDWSIKTKDQGKALDELYRASQATGIGVNDLASSVVQFGAPLRQLGFSFTQSIGLLGKWEKEGVNVQTVLAGMKIGLSNFSKAGKDPVKALQDITTKIKNAGSAGKANELAIKAFGQRAGPDMAAAIREGRFELGDLLNTIKSGKDTINKGAKDTEDFSEKWQKLKNNAFLALEPIATKVFNLMGSFADKLAAATPFITKHATAITAVAGAIAGLVAIAYTVITVMKIWTAVQTALNIVMDANPIGLIILAIAALVVGIIYAYKHSETFRNIVQATWAGIKSAASVAWSVLKAVFNGIVSAISWAVNAFTRFNSRVHSAISSVIATIRSVPGKIKSVFASAGSWLWNAGANIIRGLINGIKAQIGYLRSLLSSVTSWIPSWKGPEEKDRKLLVPAGTAIMQGFTKSIADQVPALKSTLQGVTATVQTSGNTAAAVSTATSAPSGGVGGVALQWVGGQNASDELMKWLRHNVRLVGGGGPTSVQKALGS